MPRKLKGNFIIWNLSWLVCIAAAGCQTVSQKKSQAETRQAIKSIGAAMAGRPLSPEEAQRLEQQLKADPEAQDAIRKISDSMREAPQAKYCPVGGEHYAPRLEICPIHKVKLKTVGE